MPFRLIFTVLFFGATFSATAANPELQFRIQGVKDTTVYLAYYYGNKLFYADTAKADAKGVVLFGKKKHDPGMYAVVVPGGKYFEVLLNNEAVRMDTDTVDLVGKMTVKQSEENRLFYAYMHFLSAQRKKAEPYQEKLKTVPSESEEAEEFRSHLREIDQEVKQYQRKLQADHAPKLVAKMIRLSLEPEIPEAPKNPDGSPVDSLFAYRYLRAHYFDNFDFTSESLVRTPFFHNRIDHYFKNMIPQIPDTVIAEADRVVALTAGNKEMFKYVVHYLTYTTETSKTMCMDAAFVHMVNTYYKTGRTFWLDEERLKKLINRADELSLSLCHIPCHPLSLPDSTGKWQRLYDLKADYTLVIFWDPDCGHCKKEMPLFVELYEKYKKDGILAIYTVSSDRSDKWKKYLRENGMEFTNVAAPSEVYQNQELAREYLMKGYTDLKSLNYRTTFDVFSTPKVFLLDRNKKILAKQIDPEQAEKLIEFYRNKKP